jgi:ArsR family transcriptional regulator
LITIRGGNGKTKDQIDADKIWFEQKVLNEALMLMALPVIDADIDDARLDEMMDRATVATNYLKAISHEGRLMILCHLATGEKSVTELEDLLSARQAAVSQQLGRLRLEGLVTPRREGKTIYYSLTDDKSRKIIGLVYELFCKTD